MVLQCFTFLPRLCKTFPCTTQQPAQKQKESEIDIGRVASKGSLMQPGQPFSKMARLGLRQVMTRSEEGNPTSAQRNNSANTNKMRTECTVKMRKIWTSCRYIEELGRHNSSELDQSSANMTSTDRMPSGPAQW